MGLLSDDVLKELVAVEGRFIEWEWDPQTLKSDYITMRESGGRPVILTDKSGEEHYLRVSPKALEEMIHEKFVYEDELKRAGGFRLYRLTDKGRARGKMAAT